MTGYIGHHSCEGCSKTPAFKMFPCKHGTCSDHYRATENEIQLCGTCGDEVNSIVELKPARASDPVHYKDGEWSVDKTKNLFNSLGDLNEGNNARPHPPIRHIDNTTPTPASSRPARNPNTEASNVAGSNVTGASNTITEANIIQTQPQPQRYVPPALRGMPSSNTRPAHSISTATFASQPPTPTLTTASTSSGYRFGGYDNEPSPYTLPRGHYRFGPKELPDSHASLDPFIDAPRPRPRPQPQSYVSSAGAARLAPYHGWGSGLPTQAAGGNGNANMSASADQLTPTSMNALSIGAASSLLGTRHDTPMDNHQAHAAYVAALIRSGATHDPADPRHGKPGYGEQPLKAPSAPVPMGKVSASFSNAMVPYDEENSKTKGNAAAYIGLDEVQLPAWFPRASVGYLPSVEEMMAALPMMEACRLAIPTTAGVLKLTNIPYHSSRSEIVAFLGKNARILPQPEGSPFHAVHIMMERHTAKTQECFVEFKTPKESVMVYNQLDRRMKVSRARIGDRDIGVRVVSQAEFMAELFTRAKNVEWFGNLPQVSDEREEIYPGVLASGFVGFLQNEELHYMGKHADQPHRSPFASRVPCRNYEALVTVLHKYPWYAVDHVLLEERQLMFDTTLLCIRSLMELLRQEMRPGPTERNMPTGATLHELTVAALICPGFSEAQKATIRREVIDGGFRNYTSSRGMNFRFGGVDRYSRHWPFHALVKQPGVDDKMVEYLAMLLREATTKDDNLTLTQLHAMGTAGYRPKLFGNINIDYTDVKSIADLGRVELAAIETTLARILRRTTVGSRTGSHLS